MTGKAIRQLLRANDAIFNKWRQQWRKEQRAIAKRIFAEYPRRYRHYLLSTKPEQMS